jgi:hypothetical protein
MTEHRECDVAATRSWLQELPISDGELDLALQRLLALQAAEVILPDGGSAFTHLALRLPEFAPHDYQGDPLLAIVICASLDRHGIRHEGLSSLASTYAQALASEASALPAEMALVACCLQSIGYQLPSCLLPALPLVQDPLVAERTRLLEVCRLVMTTTACSLRHLEMRELASALPALSVSYAIDWDIEAVSTFLRTAAYLGNTQASGCQWARSWLLDQQQNDGRFGLLAPEARKLGRACRDWKLYFHSTVNAIWCLAEVQQPGFLAAFTR